MTGQPCKNQLGARKSGNYLSCAHLHDMVASKKTYRFMQGSQAEGERPNEITPGTRTRMLLGAGAMAPGGGESAGWPPVFTVAPGTFTLTLACCRRRPLMPSHTQQFMSGTAHEAVKALRTQLQTFNELTGHNAHWWFLPVQRWICL